jgi:transposase
MKDFLIYETLLRLPNLTVSGVTIQTRIIEVDCSVKDNEAGCKCPNCLKETTSVNQTTTRRIRDLDISGRQVWLNLTVRQYYCSDCNRHFQEELDFVDPGNSYTHRQAKYIYLLSKHQNYSAVGAIVDMNSKTVERIVLEECRRVVDLDKRYTQVRRLGIDEQSHRKGKGDYFCVITDLDRGIVVDMIDSRLKDDLIAHFKARDPEFCAQITDVSCDIWGPYIGVHKECFPQARLILDRFHVTKILNKALDVFRKKKRKEHPDNENYKNLKWVLFKQYDKLTDDQLDRLDLAIIDCPRIDVLYKKREAFHHILDNYADAETAKTGIENWIQEVKNEKLTEFDEFVKMASKHTQAIANYVTNYLSNAVTEGLNNLIRSIRRASFGMTNFANLRLRVLGLSDGST